MVQRISWVVLVGLVAVASPAAAQDAEGREAARALFTEGVGLISELRWADAEARFRQALALHDAPSIRYNLALAVYEQGRFPEASRLVDSVLADSTTPRPIQRSSTELRRHIDRRAGYARFELGAAGSARVEVDGYELPDLEGEVPLVEGTHTARAMANAREIARASFEIATGDHRTVVLEPQVAAIDDEEPERPSPLIADPPVQGGDDTWLFVGVGAGAAVVVGLVVVIAVVATSGGGQPYEGTFEPGLLRW